jgi:hypothetical protein
VHDRDHHALVTCYPPSTTASTTMSWPTSGPVTTNVYVYDTVDLDGELAEPDVGASGRCAPRPPPSLQGDTMPSTGSTRIDAAGGKGRRATITYRVQVLSREQDGAQLRRVRVEGWRQGEA